MTKAKNEYSEIKEIRDDLDSVINNVVALGRHLQEDGIEKAAEITSELKDKTMKAAGKLAAKGEREVHAIEKHVKANPGKSLILAFATGMIASIFMKRR